MIFRYHAPRASTEIQPGREVRTIALSVFREDTARPGQRLRSSARADTTVFMVRFPPDCCASALMATQDQYLSRCSASGTPPPFLSGDPNTSLEPAPPHSSLSVRPFARMTLPPPSLSNRNFTGVSEPEPCPLGTYANSTGLRKISDCQDCNPGTYCDQRGLDSPAGLCDPGYYCLEGSYTSAPNAPGSPLSIEDTDIGGLCPGGFGMRLG